MEEPSPANIFLRQFYPREEIFPLEAIWLLAFANLGRTPGELSLPFRNNVLPKRKPAVKQPGMLTDGCIYIHDIKLPTRRGGLMSTLHRVGLTPDGEYKYFSLKDFDNLLIQYGIPTYKSISNSKGERLLTYCPELITFKLEERENAFSVDLSSGEKGSSLKNDVHYALKGYWHLVNCQLESILNGDKFGHDDDITDLINNPDPLIRPRPDLLGNKIIYKHDDIFPQVILACLVNFLVNQRELHSKLKQCPACGRFRLQEKGKRIFCPGDEDKCRGAFHDKSKKDDRDRQKTKREHKRTQEFNKLFKFLVSEYDYSEDEAKKEAKRWTNKGKNLEQYIEYH